MKLTEKLNKLLEKEDALSKMLKLTKKIKDKTTFIISDQVYSNDKSDLDTAIFDLKKELPSSSTKKISVATDTEYSNEDGFVTDGDDWEDYSQVHYVAMETDFDDKKVSAVLKRLDKKYSFYGVWVNNKQLKTW